MVIFNSYVKLPEGTNKIRFFLGVLQLIQSYPSHGAAKDETVAGRFAEEPAWSLVSLVEASELQHFLGEIARIHHIPWRIHGAAIYGNRDPINIPQSC